MDRNLIQNEHEPSVWQTFFRPTHCARPSVTLVATHLAGKPEVPDQHVHLQNRRIKSGTSRLRVNFLRLNSQGEDSRSPPIFPSFEYSFNHSEENKEMSIIKTRTEINRPLTLTAAVNSTALGRDCWEKFSPPTIKQNKSILPANMYDLITEMEEGGQPENVFQIKKSLELNKVFKPEDWVVPNENQMLHVQTQNKSIFSNVLPLTRGLPYLRPTVPFGLSASAMLFRRYKKQEPSIDSTMKSKINSQENNEKDTQVLNKSSISLAKSELANLIVKTLTMNLPQDVESISKHRTVDNDSKNIEIEQRKEHIKENKELQSAIDMENDNHKKDFEAFSRIVQVHDCEAETSSCYYSSEVSDQEAGHQVDSEKDSDEEYSDEEEDGGRYSDTSGSLSDFESDTESYDASSEYETDSEVESDNESWASDLKDPIPVCKNDIVSFILGQGSDATGGKDSGFDEGDETSIDEMSKKQDHFNDDHLWQSLLKSGDPYNPINGWKCYPSSQFHSKDNSNRKATIDNSDKQLQMLETELQNSLIDVTRENDFQPNINFATSCEPNNDIAPKSVATSCAVFKCLINTCASASNEPKLNSEVNKYKSDYTNAAIVGGIMNFSKSCFKNCRKQNVKNTKRVSFSCNDVSSFENPEWCDDYRETRKPYWESFARDRCRFRKRIQEISDSISYCFDPDHRKKMMDKLKVNV
ncbi:uncharacterized protein [Antedon mediterranea]|uniref:uncharacterized protein n=1 Tax=Antedon mediterranea TaxID=105859 RepID=UPI003AF5A567